jgi:Carbohydrate esterase, sialic acid-specific acetylesterase
MAVRLLASFCLALLLFSTRLLAQGATPSVTVMANGEALLAHPGKAYVLEWSSSNAASCLMSYRGEGQQGSYAVAPNTPGQNSSDLVGWYTLQCIGRNGQSTSKTATIVQTPSPWPATPPGGETVDEQMAPFIVAGGAGAIRWLEGDALGELLYGSDAHLYLHRIDQAATGDPIGREKVSCASIPRTALAVILIAGQSNASNSAPADGNGKYYSTHNPVYNLNIGDGKCYVAKNPLLGSDSRLDTNQQPSAQSFALPVASALIEAGLYKRVLVVPIAVSGTLIEQWIPSPPRTPGASLFNRFVSAINYLKDVGLTPTFILWHQGEGNSGPLMVHGRRGTLTTDLERAATLSWMRNFLHIVAALRGMGVDAPVFVAKATICGGEEAGAIIRKAQGGVVDRAWKIFPGPDTDAIDLALRHDGCHFSHEGNLVHAQKWYEVLRDFVGRSPDEPPALTQPPPSAK